MQQVNEGTRDQFLVDCRAGVYDGVVAISRTYDSTQASPQSYSQRPTLLHEADKTFLPR